jgi:hypothetical protein
MPTTITPKQENNKHRRMGEDITVNNGLIKVLKIPILLKCSMKKCSIKIPPTPKKLNLRT